MVIPAFNAGATLGETLTSARGQTHRDLEIFVVDDGSTDDTAEIAARHAAEDSRVIILSQANAGVAAARNTGIAAAAGAFVALLDADDLWATTKIERQLGVFATSTPRVGLVYTWFALIDAQSRIVKLGRRTDHEGDVLEALAFYNFIGNGSAPLIRRSAIEETGGFDTTLRARGGQGCEDWKLYFEVAERHHFAVVREALTGYRQLPGNMSSDVLQMLCSRDLCIGDLLPRHPHLQGQFRAGRNRLSRMLLYRAIRRGRPAEIVALLGAIGRHDPAFLARALATAPIAALDAMSARRAAAEALSGAGAPGIAAFCADVS